MFGIKYLIDIASKLNKPIAICMALGTNQGSHDGRDSLSEYLSFVGGTNGVGIVVAAGNEGNQMHHYFGQIKKEKGYDTVELNIGDDEQGFSMELWGNSPNTYSIDITSPSGDYVPRISTSLGESRRLQFLFEQTVILINYEIAESESGDPLILLRFQNSSPGIWRINVYGQGNETINYHIWLPMRNFITEETYFIQSDPDTTITSPGNAFIPITITSYNHKNLSIDPNSSRGYTRDNIVKPDVAAPGVNIYGPTSNTTYGTRSGTSVAAAIATGAAAMILEWGIVRKNQLNMDTIEITSYFVRGAKRVPSQTFPNNIWGFGILDIYNTFESLRTR